MPTTWPPRSSSGPPELPGLTAASNWMRPVQHAVGARAGGTCGRGRTMTPLLMRADRPNGWPTT